MQSQGGSGTFTGGSETCFQASSLKGGIWGNGGMILGAELSHNYMYEEEKVKKTHDHFWHH